MPPSPIESPVPVRGLCFAVPGRIAGDGGSDLRLSLADTAADALAALLPLLGCGEEAAALAFDGLAAQHRDTPDAAAALDRIAREERVHDALIARLQGALPDHIPDVGALAAARRFHIGLMRGGAAFHLARIAALDSAVCVVLARVLRAGGALAGDPVVAGLLGRIHRDEAEHVRLSRRLARAAGPTPAMRDAAAAARAGLARILAVGANAFERLGTDPDRLDRDLRRLPDGLLVS